MQSILKVRTGDQLKALRSLAMEGTGEQVFTAGKCYQVILERPLVPAVVVLDDMGEQNRIEPDFLANFIHLAA